MGPYIWQNYERLLGEAREKVAFGAWNLWWPAQLLLKARPQEHFLRLKGLPLTYEQLSALLLAGALLAVAWVVRRQDPVTTLLAASYSALASFMLPVGVHARYLLYFLALAAPVALLGRGWLALYLALSLTALLNIFAVLPVLRAGGWLEFKLAPPISLLAPAISLPLTAVNAALFLLFLALLVKGPPPPRVVDKVERG